MMQVLAEDFVCRASDGGTMTRETFVARLTGMPAHIRSVTAEHVAVHVIGHAAILTGVQIAELEFVHGGTALDRLALNNLFERRGGEWQMVMAHPISLPGEAAGGTRLRSAVPALLVADVDATARWFAANLGFHVAGIFPPHPPSVWASVQRDNAELMLQRVEGYTKPDLYEQRPGGVWHVYIRANGIHRLYEMVRDRPFVKAHLRRQPYGDWEFEVQDPNGYVLVFGGDETLSEPHSVG